MKKYSSSDTTPMVLNDFQASYMPFSAEPSPLQSTDMLDLINRTRSGIPFSRVLSLGTRLSLSLPDLADILHISSRSLHRYDADKVLARDTSAVVLRLEQLLADGLDTFGDEVDFSKWLRSSLPFLNGATPLSFLDTPFGFDLIGQVLGRIRHGIFA